jgi:hypothetical protein
MGADRCKFSSSSSLSGSSGVRTLHVQLIRSLIVRGEDDFNKFLLGDHGDSSEQKHIDIT